MFNQFEVEFDLLLVLLGVHGVLHCEPHFLLELSEYIVDAQVEALAVLEKLLDFEEVFVGVGEVLELLALLQRDL